MTQGGFERRRARAPGRGVAAAIVLLIGLVWLFTSISIHSESRLVQADVESDVDNLALSLGWQLDQGVDSLRPALMRLAARWQADGGRSGLDGWQPSPELLGWKPIDLAVTDAEGRVVAATRPDLLGSSLAGRRAFIDQRATPCRGPLIGTSTRAPQVEGPQKAGRQAGRWQIDVSQRLHEADGVFVGVVLASYDPWALTSSLEQIDLGAGGLIGLLGDDGVLQTLVAPGGAHPAQAVSASAMARAARAMPERLWTGPSASDGVVRMHAFRRLAGQPLTVVVAVRRGVAMHAALLWADTAVAYAAGISLAVLLVVWLMGRDLDRARRHARALAGQGERVAARQAEAERATTQAEARAAQFESVLASMSDGVMMLDSELRLVNWNERFALYAGLPAELLRVGTPMEDMLRAQARRGEFGPLDTEDAVEAGVQQRMQALRRGLDRGSQERLRPSGRALEFRRSALPGGGYVTLYTDTTARRQADAERQEARRLAAEAAEQKARFAALVSHDIRTPLGVLLGSLSLLGGSALSPAQRRLADTAREAGDALLMLVDDVLDMTRLAAGRLQVRPGPCDVRALLSGVAALFAVDAAARGIDLAVKVAAAIPPLLLLDCVRLRQVLTNFVSNAVKFAAPGQVALRAVPLLAGEPGGRASLRLSVCDAGPQIGPQDAARLFQPFSRLEQAAGRGIGAAPGTGLGLAICSQLAQLMGGAIGIAAIAGGGNEFWLSLPLVPAAAPEMADPPQPLGLRRAVRAAVLLVEDVAASRHVTAMLLRRIGHRVDVAADGETALSMARSAPYDIVFMDLMMPGISGVDAARALRGLPGAAGRMAIAALTANPAPEDAQSYAAVGIDVVLAKPASVDALAETIERLVRGRTPSAGPSAPAAAADELARQSSGPVLDAARLAELHALLPADVLSRLVGQCLTEIAQRLPVLGEALARGDAGAGGSAAHAIAGLAGTYGLAGCERAARAVAAAALAGDLRAARRAAAQVEPELAGASAALEAGLATWAAAA